MRVDGLQDDRGDCRRTARRNRLHRCPYQPPQRKCIVAEDEAAVAAFLREVDAACVYANVSTALPTAASLASEPK